MYIWDALPFDLSAIKVTYMLEGAFRHEDNKGHAGTIGVGDLQWMTAGRGIVHSEMPATDADNVGLQLWVNLAAKEKMTKPQYQGMPLPPAFPFRLQ